MISEQKVRANRENARASTGPQTAAGKARASRNALRHGLSHSVLEDPAWAREIEHYGKLIADEASDHRIQETARRVAAAQMDVALVRRTRGVLQANSSNKPEQQTQDRAKATDAELIAKKAAKLLALDRYERRAVSRRKFAIRALDALRREASMAPK